MKILTAAYLMILTFFVAPLSLHADFSGSARGTTSASFLKLGVGARAIALGEAYTALADEASALYWNPAGLTELSTPGSLTVMHAPYIDSSYFDYFALAHKATHGMAWGTSLQYLSAGQITQTDENNNDLGHFTPNDMALSLGTSKALFPCLSLGISLKYIQSQIIDQAKTVAVDMGVLSKPINKLKLALTVSNLGGTLKFDQRSENLPLILKAGSAYSITKDWNSSLDVGFPRDNNPYAAIGTEHTWAITETWSWAGRLGFNSRTVGGLDGFSSVSTGLGLSHKAISFDYAFLPLGNLGYTHRFSLSYGWGSPNDKEDRRISNQ